MKKGAIIIDISCDKAGGIATSVPTTINNPLYEVEGIVHYVVDHTPSLFYKTVSKSLSEVVSPFYDVLIEDKYNTVLQNCLIVKDGIIEDKKILDFQGR